MPDLVRYEAALSQSQNLARVQQARAQIERVGGRIVIEPPTATGMVMITLWLPPDYRPAQILPGLPFYPI